MWAYNTTQMPCGFCGTPTADDTKLAGLVTCESCLISEVTNFVAMRNDGVIAEVLSISPTANRGV